TELIDRAIDETYDLVVIGDCIEHLRKSDGIDLLNFLVYRTKYLWVIYPERMVQGRWEGHKSEAHISAWSDADFAWMDCLIVRRANMVAVAANGYLLDPTVDAKVQSIIPFKPGVNPWDTAD